MSRFRKLTNNLLNSNAIRVLGKKQYLRMLLGFAWNLPGIARSRDLRPLDRYMGRFATSFRFRDKKLEFDLGYSDATIQDGTYSFGIVREILIRDCYLRFFTDNVVSGLKAVVDLGANRGMFTVVAAGLADRVLGIEAQPSFRPVIEHNCQRNGFDDVAVETLFVGSGGSLGEGGFEHEDLKHLFDRHAFAEIDLLKMDIEGSEFDLFMHPDWLPRVKRICMEVHRDCGNPALILECLANHGFSIVLADSDLRRVGPADPYEFIYACRERTEFTVEPISG